MTDHRGTNKRKTKSGGRGNKRSTRKNVGNRIRVKGGRSGRGGRGGSGRGASGKSGRGRGRGRGQGRGQGRGPHHVSDADRAAVLNYGTMGQMQQELRDAPRRQTEESTRKRKSLEANPTPENIAKARSEQAMSWYREARNRPGMTVCERGTGFFNLMDVGEIGAEAADVMNDKRLIASYVPGVKKHLGTINAEPIVKNGVISSTLNTPDPGPRGSKADREIYAFKQWWMNKEPHKIYFGKEYIRTDEGHGDLDMTLKNNIGKPDYKDVEIGGHVFLITKYFHRKGFDEALENFLNMDDDDEKKKEIMAYKKTTPANIFAFARTVPARLDDGTAACRDKIEDEKAQKAQIAFDKKVRQEDEAQIALNKKVRKEGTKEVTEALDKIEDIRSKKSKTSQAAPQSSQAAPQSSQAAPQSSRQATGHTWDNVNSYRMGVRLARNGRVMASHTGAKNDAEANSGYVDDAPQGFIDLLKSDVRISFEWYGNTWKYNDDSKLYERQYP